MAEPTITVELKRGEARALLPEVKTQPRSKSVNAKLARSKIREALDFPQPTPPLQGPGRDKSKSKIAEALYVAHGFIGSVTHWIGEHEEMKAEALAAVDEGLEALRELSQRALASPQEAGEGLRESATRAVAEIDKLFEHLAGLVEEAGGLPLHERMKPLAEARADLAGVLASTQPTSAPPVEDDWPEVYVTRRKTASKEIGTPGYLNKYTLSAEAPDWPEFESRRYQPAPALEGNDRG